MRSYFRVSKGDALAFGLAIVGFVALVIVWTWGLSMPENASYSLNFHKDLMFYGMWVASAVAAILGTALTIGGLPISQRAKAQGLVESLLAVAVPLGVGAVGELIVAPPVVQLLKDKDLEIAIPGVQLAIAGAMILVSAIFAIRGAGQPGQPVIRTYIRLGMGLTFIPAIGFLVGMSHHDWHGPVRGVALGNAMFHGIIWAAFYVWIVGANLLDKGALAVPATKH
jgi:hypothetical protein